MIRCDFFCLTFDWSRVYGEEKNLVLTGISHSGKNSSVEESQWERKIVGTLRGKMRVTESWLALMPHLIGWKVCPSISGQYSARQSRTFAIIDYFLSLNQRGSRWQVSNLLQSRSATSQVHTANQLPAILFRDVFPESVQKSFSIITSDYIKFPHKTAALIALVPCIRGETVIHMFEAGL